jgi:hypothetical protein
MCREPAQAETEAKSSCNDAKSSTSGRKLFHIPQSPWESFVGPGRTRASFGQQSRRRSPPLLRYLHRAPAPRISAGTSAPVNPFGSPGDKRTYVPFLDK